MKNLLLSFAMLCFSTSVFAQLYVSPNTTTTTDSYVFVKDQILYVEEEVNLVLNTNDATTEASIYLRDGSQLIQGDGGSTANLGTGHLSVFQDSNSDSYDYNFWSSPTNEPTGSGNQNFGRARLYKDLGDTEATPATFTNAREGSSDATSMVISRRWLYQYQPASQSYSKLTTTHTVPAGQGFLMKGTNVTVHANPLSDPNNQNYDFRGRPNNGDIVVPIQTDATILARDGVNHNMTLSGNPYPSALDLNLVFNDPDNIEIDSFRFWDEDRSNNSHLYTENEGGFSIWIPGASPYSTGGMFTLPMYNIFNPDGTIVGNNGSTLPRYERLFSPIGQGFMIYCQPIAGEDGTITIKNSHRDYVKEGAGNYSVYNITGGNNTNTSSKSNSNTSSFSSDGPMVIHGPDPEPANFLPQIRVHTIFGEYSHFRDMLLVFHENSTDDYDRGLDATHPMDGVNGEAYFPLRYNQPTEYPDRNLVMQTIPYTDARKRIPIAFELTEPTKFMVKVVEQHNTEFDHAWLYDSVEGTYKKITGDEDSTQLLDAGVYEDRFFIVFRAPRGNITAGKLDPETLVAQERLAAAMDFMQNNPAGQLEVNNPEGYDVREIKIYDMSGKQVLFQQNLGTQNRLSFPTANLPDGVYLVKLFTQDNLALDYRINVLNK